MSDLQCTIQNYPNHVTSALGDKMFLHAQFCKHKAIKIMLLKAKEFSHVKNFLISANRVCKRKVLL